MLRLLIVLNIFMVVPVYAFDFSCVMDTKPSVKLVGTAGDDVASVQIQDIEDILAIRDLPSSRVVEMQKLVRKNEDRYTFVKYQSDLNAWQDLEVSLPKTINSKKFKAFLTIYNDDGDRMVPDGGTKFNCERD